MADGSPRFIDLNIAGVTIYRDPLIVPTAMAGWKNGELREKQPNCATLRSFQVPKGHLDQLESFLLAQLP